MSPRLMNQLAILLLTLSIAMEVSLLSGLRTLSTPLYHSAHLLLMATLVAAQLALFLTADKHLPSRQYALWFAIGTAFTAAGDYVNGAMSAIQPVSLKLTWAMLLFGIGYGLYIFALWHHKKQTQGSGPSGGIWLVLLFLGINAGSWLRDVEPNLQGLGGLLYNGSFIFNATLYVLMPVLSFRFYQRSGYSTGGLLICMGGILIPYSDLILFNAWLRGGNPPVADLAMFAHNWILYFGGQVLMTQFPALAMAADAQHRNQSNA